MIELLTGIIPSLLLKSLSGLVSASNLRISKLSFWPLLLVQLWTIWIHTGMKFTGDLKYLAVVTKLIKGSKRPCSLQFIPAVGDGSDVISPSKPHKRCASNTISHVMGIGKQNCAVCLLEGDSGWSQSHVDTSLRCLNFGIALLQWMIVSSLKRLCR